MDVIFGTVTADQRQADIAKQERGALHLYGFRGSPDTHPCFAFSSI